MCVRDDVVVPGNFLATFAVLRFGGQRGVDFGQMIAIEQLAIGRRVAIADAVQVAEANIEAV